MRRILFTETDFNALPNPPAGFKYIGFDGPNFSEKDEAGNTTTTGGGGGISDITYSELHSKISLGQLTPGAYYKITDFKTCYDQPDYDIYRSAITTGNYKVGNTHSIIVFATSEETLSMDALQPDFPKDRIRYDFSWTQSEITSGTAYGRITERVDEWNNRTDYDHREILFKRYDTFVYNPNSPQSGTISVANGVVSGIDTTFENFSVGDVIALPNFSEIFYQIGSIESNGTMSLTGSYWDINATDIKYYSIDYTLSRTSYYKNNVNSEDPNYIYEISTFGDVIGESGAEDNYIGDHSTAFLNDGVGNFLLANNVFLSGEYNNNRFGNSCYNNTFNDDCTNNTIGNFFRNNITDDDFDQNQIYNYFEDNIITANFQRNIVGDNFRDNAIVNGSFYRNRIGEDFYNNKISGNDFQNNVIGNAFNNNTVIANNNGFLKNTIGVGFNGNNIWDRFDSNKVGNGMNNNTLYCYSYENKIGDYFENNTIGTQEFYFDFYENDISNDFQNNQIYREFGNNSIGYDASYNVFYNQMYHNNIGNEFDNNTIGTSETRGGFDFKQNKIGYWCKGNLFLEGVESNEFGDYFWTNEFFGYTAANRIGGAFQNNDIYNGFSRNILGNACTDNIFATGSNGNNIGDEFSNNNISDDFADNRIGNNFLYNNIGNYFDNNVIGNDFNENIISYNFAYNVIGNSFYGNNIENDFGFGGGQSRGNRIGNYFYNNSIGEYFYDNEVADLFNGNTVGNYFQLNEIKAQDVYNVDFTVNYGNIVTFTHNAGLSPSIPGVDNTYTGLTTSGGSGTGSTFDVIVSGSVVTSVLINNAGDEYNVGDDLIISSSAFGGNIGQDIEINVDSISGTPVVYTTTNATIVRDYNADLKLYYLGFGGINFVGITETYD